VSRFVTGNVHTTAKAMHTHHVHGFDFVRKYMGYREE